MITVALFDLDGTLTDRAATVRGAGVALGLDVEGLLRLDPHGRWPVAWTLAHLPGVSAARWRRAVADALVPAGHVGVVARLRRRGVRVGLVSNGGSTTQRAKLRRLGLAFDAVVISGEVGLRKPDPRIFRLALRRLAATPGEAVMVGDDARLDLAPARELGVATWEATRLGELEKALASPPPIGLCSGRGNRPSAATPQPKETPCIDTET